MGTNGQFGNDEGASTSASESQEADAATGSENPISDDATACLHRGISEQIDALESVIEDATVCRNAPNTGGPAEASRAGGAFAVASSQRPGVSSAGGSGSAWLSNPSSGSGNAADLSDATLQPGISGSNSGPNSRSNSSSSAQATNQPGNREAFNSAESRYRPVAELGRGGYGVVERAVDQQLEREVAVKRLKVSGTSQREFSERFFHEARITSQLQHPSIVPVHELGTGNAGDAFYVMKLLEGQAFSEHIRGVHAGFGDTKPTGLQLRTACLPLLERFVDVCNAVAYAHKKGVIHRDLKPANVMVGEFGETIVVDWGLAKHVGVASTEGACEADRPASGNSSEQGVARGESKGNPSQYVAPESAPSRGEPHVSYAATSQGTVIGTPAYMSPEQSAGEVDQLTSKSDIYSLGVMLFTIVCGRPPIIDGDLDTLLTRIQTGELPGIREIQPAASRELAAICSTAMATRPEDRYATAEDLADDLRRFVASEPVSVYEYPWTDRLVRWCRRNQGIALTLLGSGLILLVASLVFGAVIRRAHAAEQLARRDAEQAHVNTITSLADTREAADAWLVDLSGALEFYPGMAPIRDELILRALRDYKQLAMQPPSVATAASQPDFARDPETIGRLRLEQARASLRLGDLSRLFPTLASDGPAPEEAYQNAIDLLDSASLGIKLAEQRTGRGKQSIARIQAEIELEQVNAFIGQILLSEKELDSVGKLKLDTLQRWLDEHLPSSWMIKSDWVATGSLSHESAGAEAGTVSELSSFDAKVVSAFVRLQLALNRAGALGNSVSENITRLSMAGDAAIWLQQRRGTPSDLRQCETTLTELAGVLSAAGRLPDAVHVRGKLLDLLNHSAARNPRPDLLQSIAYLDMLQAADATALRHSQVAVDLYDSAIANLNAAWASLDADNFFRHNLAAANHNVAEVIVQQQGCDLEQRRAAIAKLTRAIAIYQQLLQGEVEESTLRSLAQSHQALGKLLELFGAPEALSNFESADLAYTMLLDHELATSADQISLGTVKTRAAHCLLREGDLEASRRMLEEAAETLLKLDEPGIDAVLPQLQEARYERLRTEQAWLRKAGDLSSASRASVDATELLTEWTDWQITQQVSQQLYQLGDQREAKRYPNELQQLCDHWLAIAMESEDPAALDPAALDRAARCHTLMKQAYADCEFTPIWLQQQAMLHLLKHELPEAKDAIAACRGLRANDSVDKILQLLCDFEERSVVDPNEFESVVRSGEAMPQDQRLTRWLMRLELQIQPQE